VGDFAGAFGLQTGINTWQVSKDPLSPVREKQENEIKGNQGKKKRKG